MESKEEFTPRRYQTYLKNEALNRDIIAVLPTGSGKTFISIMLMRDRAIHEDLLCFENGNIRLKKKFVFVAPTVDLVQQQTEVLKHHLDLNVMALFGKMGLDNWRSNEWENVVRNNDCLVLTPGGFKIHGIDAGHILWNDVSLIVMDECHRATGNSDYVQIARSLSIFRVREPNARIRLLGLTATLSSPRAVTGDLINKMKNNLAKLQHNLQAHICYPDQHQKEIRECVPEAQEKIVFYDTVEDPFGEEHIIKLANVCLSSNLFEKEDIKSAALDIFDQYGSLAAEMYLLRKLKIRQKKINSLFSSRHPLSTEIHNTISAINSLVRKDEKLDSILSPKMNKLLEVITDHFSKGNGNSRCIVFVGRREWAISLASTLNHLQNTLPTCLTSAPCVGQAACSGYHTSDKDSIDIPESKASISSEEIGNVPFIFREGNVEEFLSQIFAFDDFDSEDENDQPDVVELNIIADDRSRKDTLISYDEQNDVLKKFRNGEIDIIVSTDVLREGIDVQEVNLVVSLDGVRTAQQLKQAGGRARAVNSVHAVFLKNNDFKMIRQVTSAIKMVKSEKNLLKDQASVNELKEIEIGDEEIEPPLELTRAVISCQSCFMAIERYCRSLVEDTQYILPNPVYEMEEAGEDGYRCLLKFPMIGDLIAEDNTIKGECRRTKKRAKASVAKLCVEILMKKGFMDTNLRIITTPDQECSEQFFFGDLSPIRKVEEKLIDYWHKEGVPKAICSPRESDTPMYLYSLSMLNTGNSVSMSTLGLLFCSQINSMSISELGMKCELSLLGAESVSAEQYSLAQWFQSIWPMWCFGPLESPFTEEKDASSIEKTYVVVPLLETSIDWNYLLHLKKTHGNHMQELIQVTSDISEPDLKNAVFVFGKHDTYRLSCVRHELSVDSAFKNCKVEGSKHKSTKDEDVSFGEILKSRLRIDDIEWIAGQPLLELTKFRLALKQKRKSSHIYHILRPPQLCKVFIPPIDIQLQQTLLGLPAILTHIERDLLIEEMKEKLRKHTSLHINIDTDTLGDGLRAASSDSEHNLENLESLGDCFLKLATTQLLFDTYPNSTPGKLTQITARVVNNDNLAKAALRRDIAPYLSVIPMNADDWDPLYCNRSSLKIKAKHLSDCIEAIIGTVVLSGVNDENSLWPMSLSHGGPVTNTEAQYRAGYEILEWLGIHPSGVSKSVLYQSEDMMKYYIGVLPVQGIIEYNFQNPSLLVQAFTHASMSESDRFRTRNYETLEFLGDALLDFVVLSHYWNRYPNISPKDLTNVRHYVCTNDNLARVLTKNKLHKYILQNSIDLYRAIEEYLGRSKTTNPPAPKILGDVLEALAGAVLVDSDLKTAMRVFTKFLKPYLVDLEHIEINPIERLTTLVQSVLTGDSIEWRAVEKDKWSSIQVEEMDSAMSLVCNITDLPHVIDLYVAGKWLSRGGGSNLKRARQQAALFVVLLEDRKPGTLQRAIS